MSDTFGIGIPNAKRVRRDELYGSSSDSSEAVSRSQSDAEEDAEVRAKLNERLSSLLGLDLSSTAAAPASKQQQQAGPTREAVKAPTPDEDGEQGEEFEFRLFSTSSKTAAPVKVVLAPSDDEDANLGDGAFTVAQRPTSFYLAGEPTREQIESYRETALAGDDILLGARKRAWGLERPWRVLRIQVGGPGKASASAPRAKQASHPNKVAAVSQPPSGLVQVGVGERERRKRPGKKRRIATRIKVKAEREKRDAEESLKLTKEEHLKEKKKRLNREKKLKRRAKEREQKLVGKDDE